MPPPQALTASITPSENPRLIANFEFSSDTQAREFTDSWPDFVDAVGDLGIPGLGSMLSGLEIKLDGHHVFVDGQLNGFFVKLLFTFVTKGMPELKPALEENAPVENKETEKEAQDTKVIPKKLAQ